MTCINPSHNGKVATWCSDCYDAMKLQIDELKRQSATDVKVMGDIDKARDTIAAERDAANRLVDEAKAILKAALHEDCNGIDSTCTEWHRQADAFIQGKSLKRKCEVKTQAGFPCSLPHGHEGVHQVVVGWNS